MAVVGDAEMDRGGRRNELKLGGNGGLGARVSERERVGSEPGTGARPSEGRGRAGAIRGAADWPYAGVHAASAGWGAAAALTLRAHWSVTERLRKEECVFTSAVNRTFHHSRSRIWKSAN